MPLVKRLVKGTELTYEEMDGNFDHLESEIAGRALSGHNHDGTYDPAGTAAAAVTAHEQAVDPHPGYLTQAEGNAAYEAAGAVAAHVAAPDPHTQYLVADDVAGKTNMSGFPVDSAGAYLVTLSYNETTRTTTITPTGASFDVFVAGVKYTKTAQSIQHPATHGGHFIYYDNTGTLVTGTSPWNLMQTAPLAFVFWDATNNVALPFDERHHAGRDLYWHRNQHTNEGTKISSGFSASGFSLNDGSTDAAVTWAIASGRVEDEDIRIDTQPLADGGPYTIMERVGASGEWRLVRGNTLPFLRSGNNLQYNQLTGGVWQRSNVPEDQFVNYYVFAVTALPTTSITPAPAATQQIIIVPGQVAHATEAAAHGEQPGSLTWGTFPFQEIAPLYQITMRFNASNPAAFANTARCAITRFVRTVGSAAVLIAGQAQTDHGALAGLSDDDHPQYHTDERGDARYSQLGHTHSGLVPAGGGSGQLLSKASASDFDMEWIDAPSGGGGGMVELVSEVTAANVSIVERALDWVTYNGFRIEVAAYMWGVSAAPSLKLAFSDVYAGSVNNYRMYRLSSHTTGTITGNGGTADSILLAASAPVSFESVIWIPDPPWYPSQSRYHVILRFDSISNEEPIFGSGMINQVLSKPNKLSINMSGATPFSTITVRVFGRRRP